MSDKIEVKNHDEHYARQGIQPILVLEQIAENLDKTKLSAKQKHNILEAGKYLLRLGTKDDPEKELDKLHNYVTRAYSGEWRK